MKRTIVKLIAASAFMAGAHVSVMAQDQWVTSSNGKHISNTNTGSVGIGTGSNSPAAKLQVVGGSDAVLSTGGYITLGNTTTTNLALDDNEIMARNNGHAAILYVQADGGSVYLHSNLGTSTLTVFKDSGDVGIGTTSPQSKLAVNGTITAREVVITDSGWADFVFDPSYRLTPLEEVADFVRENRHLPDVPSERQVLTEGVNVGDMQVKLLQKVEELTLYAIEQNKVVADLENENADLLERISALEKAIGLSPANH